MSDSDFQALVQEVVTAQNEWLEADRLWHSGMALEIETAQALGHARETYDNLCRELAQVVVAAVARGGRVTLEVPTNPT